MDDKKLNELNQLPKTEVMADKELEREKQRLSEDEEEEKAPSRMSLPLGIDEHWSLSQYKQYP